MEEIFYLCDVEFSLFICIIKKCTEVKWMQIICTTILIPSSFNVFICRDALKFKMNENIIKTEQPKSILKLLEISCGSVTPPTHCFASHLFIEYWFFIANAFRITRICCSDMLCKHWISSNFYLILKTLVKQIMFCICGSGRLSNSLGRTRKNEHLQSVVDIVTKSAPFQGQFLGNFWAPMSLLPKDLFTLDIVILVGV